MRNQHADESRKEKITRTGQGVDEMYKSKWIYLESLTFVSTEDNIIRKLFLTNIVSIVKKCNIIRVIFVYIPIYKFKNTSNLILNESY